MRCDLHISGILGVREWHTVTVALCCRSRFATGTPTMLLRPMTTACLPAIVMVTLPAGAGAGAGAGGGAGAGAGAEAGASCPKPYPT